jgi:hypothetical protein
MKLSELSSLAKAISRNKIKQIELLGREAEPTSDADRLYRALQEDVYESEAEAAEAFYGDVRYRRHYFGRLKRKLREKLVNTLFFVDIGRPDFSDMQKAYYSCYRYAVAVKVLIGRFSRKLAAPLARHTLRKAIQYEFTDIILMMANELRFHYGAMEGQERAFWRYDELVRRYQLIYQAELSLEGHYTELAMHFSAAKATRLDIYQKAKAYAAFAEEQLLAAQSYQIGLYAFSTIVMQYQIRNEHEGLLESCDRALAYFGAQQGLSLSIGLFSFSFKKLPSLIMFGKYEAAEETVQYCLELAPEGRLNYFKVMEYYLILSFHAQRYEQALQIRERAHAVPGIEQQGAAGTESWQLYDAYLHLFAAMGKIGQPPSGGARAFRLNRFLNSLPQYTKDKRGANITILVLQVLFLLQQKRYGVIIDRVEALKTYTSRYLRKDETFRSNCFLKMLLLLPACRFHKVALKNQAAPLRKRLDEMPMHAAQQNLEVEIVPYEMLWELVLELLE